MSTRLTDLNEIVRLPKGSIVPGQEPLQHFLGGLLRVEDDVFQDGRCRSSLMIGGEQIPRSLGNPAPDLGDPDWVMRHRGAFLLEAPSQARKP